MDCREPSPFQQWMYKNLRGMAVSADIRELLALAFEGGRKSVETQANNIGVRDETQQETNSSIAP